jgi:MFS family permease
MASLVHRLFALSVGVVMNTLVAGVVFGWPAMDRILIAEHVYSAMSSDDRTLKLNFIFTVACGAASGGGLVFGPILDRVGPLLTALIGCVTLSEHVPSKLTHTPAGSP